MRYKATSSIYQPPITALRRRLKLTLEQAATLDRAFARDPMPSNQDRLQLSLALDVPTDFLRQWFQNQRSKGRKRMRLKQELEQGVARLADTSRRRLRVLLLKVEMNGKKGEYEESHEDLDAWCWEVDAVHEWIALVSAKGMRCVYGMDQVKSIKCLHSDLVHDTLVIEVRTMDCCFQLNEENEEVQENKEQEKQVDQKEQSVVIRTVVDALEAKSFFLLLLQTPLLDRIEFGSMHPMD